MSSPGRRIAIGLLWGWVCLFRSMPVQAADPHPFFVGENLRYGIRWEKIDAGSCWLKVLPFTLSNGSPAWHFHLKAKSNSMIDLLHKVRDYLDSHVARDFSASLFYGRRSRGKRKKKITVWFDPEKGLAQYANFGGKRDPVTIAPNSFDPLASFYRMRTLDLVVGSTLEFPVSDGKKAFFQKGDVVGKERVSVPWGTVDTLVLVPYTTHFSGVFSRSKDPTVRVWISDDARRLPVKVQIRVVIGSLYFELETADLP